MAQRDATIALNRINLRAAMIAPQYMGIVQDLRQLAAADNTLEADDFVKVQKSALVQNYGFAVANDNKPFAFSNGLAIIPIQGTMINRFSYSFGYVTGYNFVRAQLAAALADDDVKGIVFDVNSYGGEAAGCFELADDIYAARDQKPILAVVDSNCYSAAYALASSATKVVSTPSGGSGSIGVVTMHADMSKYFEDWGITITFIYAGDHKVDGNPYQALSAEVKAAIQADVDAAYDDFVALVARNRGMDQEAVRATQAQTYRADDALNLGLIDAVAKPIDAVASFLTELSAVPSLAGNQTEHMMELTEEQLKQKELEAAQAAVKADRERSAAIVNCEAAKDRPKLAAHLAMNTDMSLEAAKATLEVAPKETAAAGTEAGASAFHDAMNGGDNPNVGAHKRGSGAEATTQEKTNALLADYAAVTGTDLLKK